MAALLRTDDDRGPMVAVGLVTLTVAVLLIDIRFSGDWAAGVRTLVTGVPALLALGLAFDLDKPLRTFRWLLMLAAIVLAASGVALRAARPRHGLQLLNAAGLVTVGLALTFAVEAFIAAIGSAFGGGSGASSGWGWELFVLVVGAALVAYAVANREPGPGYLGAFNLLAFVLMASKSGDSPSLIGWPLVLLIVALATLGLALRPQPRASTPAATAAPPSG